MKIFIIEDHPYFIKGIKDSLREKRNHISVAGSSSSLNEGIRKALQVEFDVFILDLYLPGSDPLENIKKLKTVFPDKPVVILTSENKSIWKYRMAVAGAMGYIQKDSPPNVLLDVLRNVEKGISTISPSDFIPKPGEAPFLTPDQQEIVLLLSKGKTLKDIDNMTNIKSSMIEKNLSILRKTFNAKTNPGLIKVLTDLGFI